MKAIHIPSYVTTYASLLPTTVPAPQPTPAAPIHIRIHHAALNYVDLLYARGLHQNNAAGLVAPPFTLGLEFAGVVLAAPPPASPANPAALQPGDRVFGGCPSGAFAEEVCVAAAQVRRVPVCGEGWALRGAAGVAATAPVAYGALVRCAGLRRGETVLVHAAAGGLGVMAVQIARAVGARVIAAVGSEGKAEVVRRVLGVAAGDVVNYSEEGWEGRVLGLTGGKAKGGVDVVFDTVGLVEKSIRCTKYAGRVVVAGFAGREGNLEKVAANRILLKSVSVIGYVSSRITVWRRDYLLTDGTATRFQMPCRPWPTAKCTAKLSSTFKMAPPTMQSYESLRLAVHIPWLMQETRSEEDQERTDPRQPFPRALGSFAMGHLRPRFVLHRRVYSKPDLVAHGVIIAGCSGRILVREQLRVTLVLKLLFQLQRLSSSVIMVSFTSIFCLALPLAASAAPVLEKRLSEEKPWTLSNISVFTANKGAAATSYIDFVFSDVNKGLKLTTRCSHFVLPGSNENIASGTMYPCANSTVGFGFTGSEFKLQRTYRDDS
ncbi:hypothetical protein FH972_021383 [Carpinus fangiana]|uniref:Enoyl reductase (ER) domain-containing protein n=1 Tax=Carpinus fangiana TaxID=176857 RepID=A0A5N6KPR6_9ROSI|nr:hypothetical protein FH972_021383 [Carpinus fangiana]